jgi:hypothetical protein
MSTPLLPEPERHGPQPVLHALAHNDDALVRVQLGHVLTAVGLHEPGEGHVEGEVLPALTQGSRGYLLELVGGPPRDVGGVPQALDVHGRLHVGPLQLDDHHPALGVQGEQVDPVMQLLDGDLAADDEQGLAQDLGVGLDPVLQTLLADVLFREGGLRHGPSLLAVHLPEGHGNLLLRGAGREVPGTLGRCHPGRNPPGSAACYGNSAGPGGSWDLVTPPLLQSACRLRYPGRLPCGGGLPDRNMTFCRLLQVIIQRRVPEGIGVSLHYDG